MNMEWGFAYKKVGTGIYPGGNELIPVPILEIGSF